MGKGSLVVQVQRVSEAINQSRPPWAPTLPYATLNGLPTYHRVMKIIIVDPSWWLLFIPCEDLDRYNVQLHLESI